MDFATATLMSEYEDLYSGNRCGDEFKPTSSSIDRIQAHFGVMLPPLLIALARNGRGFRQRFASLGSDYDFVLHIVRINSCWRRRRRTRRVPRGFIILTCDYDDRHWCLDTNGPVGEDGSHPMQFWTPGGLVYPNEADKPTERYPDFTTFLRADIYWARWHRDAANKRRR